MKTRRFDFNWKPLQLQISFTVEGSVPDRQNYNAYTGEFTPDYTITPFIIQPVVSVLDKDEMVAAGRVNQQLTNVRWHEIIAGTKRQITDDNSGYEVTTSGGEAGRIKVKKNAQPKNPITLSFYAEYIDKRNGQIMVIQGSYMLNCSDAADTVRVELDAAGQTIYNPLADAVTQSITATTWVGDKVCKASQCAYYWEVQDGAGSWHQVGSDDLDYDVERNGQTVTVNRWLMGKELHLRCWVKFSPDSDPTQVKITPATPHADIVIIRRLPAYEYDIAGVPYNIPADAREIAPTAIVRTTNREIANFETELLPLWYIATNNVSGSLNYTLAGHGSSPIISTSAFNNNNGAVLGLDVKDRGAAGAWADANGAVFCDADGAILIIH